jgi:ATP-dependent DNA ligase
MFSRNGKQFSNFTHIEEQFSNIAAMLSEPYVFDGEIMSSSFQDLMKQVRRKKDVAAEDAVLFLFDMIPLADFMNGQCSTSQLDRLKQLHKFYNTENVFTKLENVELLEYADINLDTPAGKTELNEINKRAIDGGYEGIMLKDPLAPYECKRTASWLKIKPFIEVTLTVVAVEEGTGRNEGRLGAFVCKGTDDGCYIEVNCGSGFSDRERQQYWDFRELCVNNLVEIRADAITQNQDGTYSLRFPRFKTFRGFAPGEKI